MRHLVVLIALIATPALAQDSESCAAEESFKILKKCELEGSWASKTFIDCLYRHSEIFGKGVDATYKDLLSTLSDEDEKREVLVASQTAWKTYNENWCRFRAFSIPATIKDREESEHIVYANCLNRGSVARGADLLKALHDGKPKPEHIKAPYPKHTAPFFSRCQTLWYERNSIYHAAGYCFKTTRAIKQFGNDGCRFHTEDEVPLSDKDRRRISEIKRQEKSNKCRR